MGWISERGASRIVFAARSGIAAFVAGTRTVDLHLRRLSSKLGPELEHLIETVRGVGYRAADDR